MAGNWISRYAPQTLDEMVVSDANRSKLERIIMDLPNTLLYGNPGTGKSSFMKVLEKQTGGQLMKINASNENGIDVIRGKVETFSKSASIDLIT